MRDIALFVEDQAHKEFLAALLQRLAGEAGVEIRMDWRNARRGHGAVVTELKQYFRDLMRGRDRLPDLIVVATDANCKGLVERLRQVNAVTDKALVQTVCAVPDPHIERWLLADSAAFKAVFGRGCAAPDAKCERSRYKKMLVDAIRATGIAPSLGGIEFADDIVGAMDLSRVAGSDASLGRFIEEARKVFKGWRA
ncbi:MAG: DUF4276 family protein [Azonexus sp.]|jgi:hypothetical protein|nr:DUF4276 family protein [Betaproteobacteria bacterium]MBK8919112.1 DUF4276 family protein [Betaproteobacteria bacterium]MBP6036566.1 DUF4276 family protein [Azonexus sp.]MBP6907174.1 DUF4276 family protein [Azonexus sp.]